MSVEWILKNLTSVEFWIWNSDWANFMLIECRSPNRTVDFPVILFRPLPRKHVPVSGQRFDSCSHIRCRRNVFTKPLPSNGLLRSTMGMCSAMRRLADDHIPAFGRHVTNVLLHSELETCFSRDHFNIFPPSASVCSHIPCAKSQIHFSLLRLPASRALFYVS
jgi:hypothetical protein